MEHHAADELDVEVAHAQHALPCLAHHCEDLGEQGVQRFPGVQARLELCSLVAQGLVGEGGQRRLMGIDLLDRGTQTLERAFVLGAHDLGQEGVEHRAPV